MRQPRPENFDTKLASRNKPESVDVSGIIPIRPKPPTNRVTEVQGNRVTDLQTNRVTDFADYEVPIYSDLSRLELRLTWEQTEFLESLDRQIAREAPEGDKKDPTYKRITKNSVVRALVEILRRLNPKLDAGRFYNEQDLVKALFAALGERLTDLQTNRPTD
jgi:hypothetical protein